MRFARILPNIRTPLGIEGFDYRIPEDMEVEVGMLVTIPFRGKKIQGIVEQLSYTSSFAHKALPISEVHSGIRFPSSFLSLIRHTSERTFSSPSTVLKSWLRNLPKKIDTPPFVASSKVIPALEATWNNHATDHLIRRAQSQMTFQRVLVVTPWISRAESLHNSLPGSHLLHSQLSDGEAFQRWTHFLSKETGCLITTKIGAWLASACELVLLDEPEQDDHKQDDLSPRYDARKILLWCAQKGVTRVESFGLTPPLHSPASAPDISSTVRIFVYHPQGRSVIPFLQADALQQFIDYQGPRVIIHPIKGLLARVSCRDCQWQAMCERCGFPLSVEEDQGICRHCQARTTLPHACPVCQGVDLSKSLPGIERLKKLWLKHFPNISVEWRDATAEHLEKPFAIKSLLLLTDVAFLGTGEDIRRRERQCIALRRLADRAASVDGYLLLQSQEDIAPLLSSWFTSAGMKTFVEHERAERRLFGYPPSRRLVKIIIKGDETQALAWQQKAETHLQHTALPAWQWRGPFRVAYQPKTRTKRSILHLTFPPDTPEPLLISCLRPLVYTYTLIDLDPVAFLR